MRKAIVKTAGLCCLILMLMAGCQKSEVGSKSSELENLVKTELSASDGGLVFAHPAVSGLFSNVKDALRTPKEQPEVMNALLGQDEKALVSAMESAGVYLLAVPFNPDRDDAKPGSMLWKIANNSDFELLSYVTVTKKVLIVQPTAKAYRLSTDDLTKIMAYARAKLSGEQELPAIPQAISAKLKEKAIVDLRFSDSGGFNKKVGLVRGEADTLKGAIDNALAEAATRYEKRGGGGFTGGSLKVYLADTRITFNFYRERGDFHLRGRELSDHVSLALDGLILHFPKTEKQRAKTVVVSPDKAKIYRVDRVEKLMETVCKRERLDKDAWKQEGVRMEKFRTLDFSEETPNGKVLHLFRGVEYVDPAKLDKKETDIGFRQGAEWLISVFDEETRMYKYEYYAVRNTYKERSYNIIRHGLGTLTLIQAYELYGDERYLNAARLAIEWVIDLVEWEGDMAMFRHPRFDPSYKLGGAGVMVQAMCEYYRLKPMPEWEKVMKGLGVFMMNLQKENGHYKSFYTKPGQKENDREVTIYPGEANLALVRLYRIFKDKRFLDTVDKAFKYYSEWYADKKNPRSKGVLGPFVPWDMSAMLEFWEEVRRDDVAEYAYDMADWILDNWFIWDYEQTYWKDYVGGVHNSKRLTDVPIWNAGVYGEGIASVFRIAQQKGDKARMEKYRKATFLLIRFIRQLQYRWGSIYYLPAPAEAVGAIPSSFTMDDCRIDYVYHPETVNYRALRFFTEEDWKALSQ